MKRILSVFLVCVIVLTSGACSSKNSSSKSLLKSVLSGEKTFISEKGEAVLLKNYAIARGELATQLFANPVEYAFVDFDKDKIDELVINISSNYGYYLVLRCDGLDVYGYEFRARALQLLKKDGSFMSSGGVESNYYCKLTFEDNKANVIYTAIKDSTMNIFELDGKECSIEELNEYINDWDSKKSVKWIEIKTTEQEDGSNAADNNDESIPTDNRNESDTTSSKEESSTTSNKNESNTASTKKEPNASGDSAKINLNNYVSVSFSGKNLAGYGSVTFDKEQFLLDHISNISFNKENAQVYKELYGGTDTSAANAIVKYISVRLDKNHELSNGDTVRIVWKIDTDKVETYFKWNYVCTSEPFTVAGLKEADTFDPFEKMELTFSGTAPYGTVKTYNWGSYNGGTYKVSPESGLKNGDKVTVTYSCSDKATMIASYGKYPSLFEKIYVVSGLNTYVKSVNDISNDQLDKLISNAREKIWVLGYGNYKEAKYCGNYFYYTKSEPTNDYGNAIHFVFEHPEQIGATNSPNAYTVISLKSLKMNEKGELIYSKHDMEQRYNMFKSKEELNKVLVDECDNKMSCSNNTKFD